METLKQLSQHGIGHLYRKESSYLISNERWLKENFFYDYQQQRPRNAFGKIPRELEARMDAMDRKWREFFAYITVEIINRPDPADQTLIHGIQEKNYVSTINDQVFEERKKLLIESIMIHQEIEKIIESERQKPTLLTVRPSSDPDSLRPGSLQSEGATRLS